MNRLVQFIATAFNELIKFIHRGSIADLYDLLYDLYDKILMSIGYLAGIVFMSGFILSILSIPTTIFTGKHMFEIIDDLHMSEKEIAVEIEEKEKGALNSLRQWCDSNRLPYAKCISSRAYRIYSFNNPKHLIAQNETARVWFESIPEELRAVSILTSLDEGKKIEKDVVIVATESNQLTPLHPIDEGDVPELLPPVWGVMNSRIVREYIQNNHTPNHPPWRAPPLSRFCFANYSVERNYDFSLFTWGGVRTLYDGWRQPEEASTAACLAWGPDLSFLSKMQYLQISQACLYGCEVEISYTREDGTKSKRMTGFRLINYVKHTWPNYHTDKHHEKVREYDEMILETKQKVDKCKEELEEKGYPLPKSFSFIDLE